MQVAGQPRSAEDLALEIDVLMESEKDMSLLSFVNFLPRGLSVQNEKHEWLDDQMPPETFTAQGTTGATWDSAVATVSMPVITAQIGKLKVGDVLELPSGEHTVVDAINVAGQTITLAKRGWGGTTAAAQGTSVITIKIIGNAQIDGSDPQAETYWAPTAMYNYVQVFEDVLAVSGKVMRSKISRESERARQRGIKLKRLLSQLNFAILNGSRDKYLDRTTFQGIRNASSSTYNVGGALTVAKVYAMVIQMVTAGGSPSAIHGSATGISRIEMLMANNVTSGPAEFNAKLTVKKLSMLGMDIELHVDKHMLDTEFLVLDYGRLRIRTMDSDEAKGAFAAYTITENGKQIKEQIAGYYTFEQKQQAASAVRAYGCTS